MDYKAHQITSLEEIEDMIGTPSKLAENKVVHHLDEDCISFIKASPFLVISTSNQSGNCDASPRGDKAGFVHILDEKHFIIPERPGNRRIDSIKNIITNSQIGILFIIPGLNETLRINGKAIITSDKNLLNQLEANGHIPSLGIIVEVEEIFIHCAKAFIRSSIWNPENWPKKKDYPSPSQMLARHTRTKKTEVEKQLKESYLKRLY